MSAIHLARGLTLDAREIATEVTGLIGMRGSGKSNAMGVIAEALLATKVQVVILDYVGSGGAQLPGIHRP
jgi:ABC-type multidrug transport system ATPase subunit